jgi:hypothetical protein
MSGLHCAVDWVSPNICLDYDAGHLPILHQAVRDAGGLFLFVTLSTQPQTNSRKLTVRNDSALSCSPLAGLQLSWFRHVACDAQSTLALYGPNYVYSVSFLATRLGATAEWAQSRGQTVQFDGRARVHSAGSTAQLVALWSLAAWNCAMSRLMAQTELIAAWRAFCDLSLYHLVVKTGYRELNLLKDITVAC